MKQLIFSVDIAFSENLVCETRTVRQKRGSFSTNANAHHRPNQVHAFANINDPTRDGPKYTKLQPNIIHQSLSHVRIFEP